MVDVSAPPPPNTLWYSKVDGLPTNIEPCSVEATVTIVSTDCPWIANELELLSGFSDTSLED